MASGAYSVSVTSAFPPGIDRSTTVGVVIANGLTTVARFTACNDHGVPSRFCNFFFDTWPVTVCLEAP